jgi:hypothetical protein
MLVPVESVNLDRFEKMRSPELGAARGTERFCEANYSDSNSHGGTRVKLQTSCRPSGLLTNGAGQGALMGAPELAS